MNSSLLTSQKIVRVCLVVLAIIALSGGASQMYLGEPETTPRLDNIHRFMAGVYFSCGLIAGWAAITIQKQNTLIFLLALAVFLGGTGRLISISVVGLPEPQALWLRYLIPELTLPLIMAMAQRSTNRNKERQVEILIRNPKK